MNRKISLRMPWLLVVVVFCLAASAFGLLLSYPKAEASANTSQAVTAAMLDEDDDCEDQLFATLRGPTIGGESPRGFAKFKLDANGNSQNRLKVFVRSVNLPEGTPLRVYVDGNFVGQILHRANGNSHGFFDPDLNITEGSVVQVRNGGNVILFGTLEACDTPTPTATPSPGPTCATLYTLSGSQEVPPTNSIGAGVATVFLSGNQTVLSINIGFSGLSSAATAAHIHGPALPGSNAPVIFPLADVPNVASGYIPTQSFLLNPTQAAQLYAGLLYVNLHTGNFPGGEIRAQITGSGCQTSTPTSTPTASPTPPQATLFDARLQGSRVVPPVETEAHGSAGVVLDETSTRMQAYAAFANLTGTQTSATINCGALPGQNVPPTFALSFGGTTSGVVTGTFPVTPLEAAELRAGLCYVVIGSQTYIGGEIRGQLRNHFTHRDFDGDGRSDLAVFRPSNGTWYFKNSADNGFAAEHFGMVGDKPVAGDFDGDGMGDVTVFRNVSGSGMWFIRNSSDGSIVVRQWGLGSDIPISGDFDGDGRSDLAVFRPSEGNWYISRSSNSALTAMHWGISGDIPMSGDYDGDGMSDMAVFRPSIGTWFINRSSDGQFAMRQWGVQGDRPVVGDFDGDGIDDVAVFRSSDGNWYINGSRGAFISIHFGANGDIPVAGRFDDDTKTDLAVFRPTQGIWYILKSQTNSVTATNFGVSGDLPIVNY